MASFMWPTLDLGGGSVPIGRPAWSRIEHPVRHGGASRRFAGRIIEVAGAEAFEVERDVAVTSRLHRRDDRLTLGHGATQFRQLDLDARRVAVVADTDLG